jgi:uncharacterized membrane protein YjjP (DUF1212 family)
MFEPDISYYNDLQQQLVKSKRWLMFFMAGLLGCLVYAINLGPTDGWFWLIGSLAFIFGAISARIDHLQTALSIQIYLAGVKN